MGTIWHHLPAHSFSRVQRKGRQDFVICGETEREEANEWDGEEWEEYVHHVTERMIKRGKDAALVTVDIYV